MLFAVTGQRVSVSRPKAYSPTGPRGASLLKTDLEKLCWKWKELIETGSLLVVDPSSSSSESQPGWATFSAQKLTGAGVLDIVPGMRLNRKLHRIVTDLRSFPPCDMLVLELIAPFYANRGFNKSNVSLQRACGAIMGAVETEHCIEVPSVTWYKYIPEGYQKTDMNDALMLGLAVYETWGRLVKQDVTELRMHIHSLVGGKKND